MVFHAVISIHFILIVYLTQIVTGIGKSKKKKSLVRNTSRKTLSTLLRLSAIVISCLVPRFSGSIDFRDVYGSEMPRQLQNAHAFGSGVECLLILADFQGIILLVFGKSLVTAGNRWNLLLDRLCSPGNYNYSHQTTQSGKIIWTRGNAAIWYRSLAQKSNFLSTCG